MPAVVARDLSKAFVVRRNRNHDLKVRFLGMFHRRHREQREHLWALRDVSLEVERGECFGVVGPNGSGKSTLLRLMARIYDPTRGSVVVGERVAPMLELGVGFHPELSGRENVHLSTSLLGLSRRETDRLYPAVVEFAGLGDFMDVPVKSYSTGMAMRLGFAVAVHLEAGVYLIDEVLAVGDGAFREKCLDRIREIRHRGRTIVLVSHDLGLVERMCDRACLLVAGTVSAQGETTRVLDRYQGRTRHAG